MIVIKVLVNKGNRPYLGIHLQDFFEKTIKEVMAVTGEKKENLLLLTEDINVISGPPVLVEIVVQQSAYQEQTARSVASAVKRTATLVELDKIVIVGNFSKPLGMR